MKNPLRNKINKGMTLLEIIIVTTIIAIVATIAVPALNSARKDAKEMKVKQALQKVDEAKIHYYMDTGLSETPPSATLLSYMDIPGFNSSSFGLQCFYSEKSWEKIGGPRTDNTGALLDGIDGYWYIQINQRGVPASFHESNPPAQ